MIEFLSKPWSWYVAGPMIGLMVPLLLIFLNKPFGISSSLRHMCAMCLPINAQYFKYDWKKESWNLLFVLGIAIGAFLVYFFFPNPNPIELATATKTKLAGMGVNDFNGLLPEQLFNWEVLASPFGIVMLVVGGFLVGFGTRYAGGCTSGHAIMGLSQLSLGSLVATIGFFAGGLLVSWFVVPIILTWL